MLEYEICVKLIFFLNFTTATIRNTYCNNILGL